MTKMEANDSAFSVQPITDTSALVEELTRPDPDLIESLRTLEGDILILGVNGKMGPTLACLAARAIEAAGIRKDIIGVSRSLEPENQGLLEEAGVTAIKADLLAPGALDALPDAANVIYMCGRKFGSTGAEWDTWATNVFLAGMAAKRYRDARIVAFSSGNVYPFVPVTSGGATESIAPDPVGEYAMSCLGRERMFDYYAHHAGTKVLHFRLNYAVELRYGVLHDVAAKVWNEQPVDLTVGNANVVWQGYANSVALRALALASVPPHILNVTGPETVSIRNVAERMGQLMDKTPIFIGAESPNALLSNASKCHKHFGNPPINLDILIKWTAHWIMTGGESLNKPTHFEVQDGRF